MLETNKTPKSYVAAIGYFLLAKGAKWACVRFDLSMCQNRRCAPLERWRILMWAANLLRGGAPISLQILRGGELEDV